MLNLCNCNGIISVAEMSAYKDECINEYKTLAINFGLDSRNWEEVVGKSVFFNITRP
jgi:hypothetical protein